MISKTSFKVKPAMRKGSRINQKNPRKKNKKTANGQEMAKRINQRRIAMIVFMLQVLQKIVQSYQCFESQCFTEM